MLSMMVGETLVVAGRCLHYFETQAVWPTTLTRVRTYLVPKVLEGLPRIDQYCPISVLSACMAFW